MGKGDSRRPAAVPRAVVEANYERTFGRSSDHVALLRHTERTMNAACRVISPMADDLIVMANDTHPGATHGEG